MKKPKLCLYTIRTVKAKVFAEHDGGSEEQHLVFMVLSIFMLGQFADGPAINICCSC